MTPPVVHGGKATIRTASKEEAQSLTRLAVRSKAHWGYDKPTMEVFARELQMSTEQVQSWIVRVLEDEGRVLGFYALRSMGAGDVDLERMFIDPQGLRRGYGRRLIEDAVRTASAHGFRRLVIMSDPHAEGFYRALGARRVGDVASSIPGRTLPLFHLDLPPGDGARPPRSAREG